jgi:hypothetical protein
VEFNDVIGLGKALRDNPSLPSCLVDRLYSYGSGGAAKPTDRPLMKYYNAEFAEAGYKLTDLLRVIATSETFQHVTETKQAGPSELHEATEEIPIEEMEAAPTIVSAPATSKSLQAVAQNQGPGHDRN